MRQHIRVGRRSSRQHTQDGVEMEPYSDLVTIKVLVVITLAGRRVI